MCEPVSITMGAIAVAGAVQGSMAAEDAEDAQYASNAANAQHRAGQYRRALSYQRKLAKWQKNVYDETAKSVRTSTTGQYAAVIDQIDQVRDATLASVMQAGKQANAASSFIRAAAGETGTTGNSIALAQQQAELSEANFAHNAFTNFSNRHRQSKREMSAMFAQGQNIINRAMPGPLQPPDIPQGMAPSSAPSALPYVIQGAAGVTSAVAYQQQVDTAAGNPWTG